MTIKDESSEWILNRTANNVKTTRYDMNIAFGEVPPRELSHLLAELMDDGLIDLKNYEYRAVVRQ
jgi:CRP-like cAMP-binding protein